MRNPSSDSYGLFYAPYEAVYQLLVTSALKVLHVLDLDFYNMWGKGTFDICFCRMDYNHIRWAA